MNSVTNDFGKRAVVLLSGGLDSATVLAIARSEGYECYALSLDYGQRHNTELNAARKIAINMQVASHQVINLDLRKFGGSALTDDSIAVPTEMSDDIPVTYVPARNTIFLSLALAWAETLEARDIFVGVNAVDYSGYPDCRPEYIKSFEDMANLATRAGVEGDRFSIKAPLIQMTKSDIIQTGSRLGVDYALTISCYQADGQGRACGECDSCRLRRQGFEQANVQDPTVYQD
jgi:7-cyano-7-deazaguanine synthase